MPSLLEAADTATTRQGSQRVRILPGPSVPWAEGRNHCTWKGIGGSWRRDAGPDLDGCAGSDRVAEGGAWIASRTGRDPVASLALR